MNYSAEQLENAVSAARAEAEADFDAKINAAVEGERSRLAAILQSPMAKGKEQQAIVIALSGATAKPAEQILAVAKLDTPATTLLMDRAKDAPGGLVTIDPAASSPAPAGQNAAWQASIDRVNARFDQENPNDRH